MSEFSRDQSFSSFGGGIEEQWYVQQGSRLQGPYSAQDIGRYLLLGRIRRNDRVSRDGELWEPVTQVPELVPEELLDLDSEQGWQQYLEKYRSVDERTAVVTSGHDSHLADPQFRAPQFNHVEIDADNRVNDEESAHEQMREDWADAKTEPVERQATQPISLLPISLLGLTLVALLVIIYLNTVNPLL